MADTPPTDPPPVTPPTEDDQKKKLHVWLDEWADAREKKNPPQRTKTGEPSTVGNIFTSLFGG